VGRSLILDTNVLIAYERGSIDRTVFRNDELSIAAVTLAEYRVGIEMADTVERAATRARWSSPKSMCWSTRTEPPIITHDCSHMCAGPGDPMALTI
jgi:predicted nucleic acid-binding protein